MSDDTFATLNACVSLGARISFKGTAMTINGTPHLKSPATPIDCKESASTIRFMAAISALAEGVCTLTGSPGLLRRPINHLIESLRQLGVKCEMQHSYPPVKIYGGGVPGGRTDIVGHVSSQFITALLFIGPLARRDCKIKLITPLESKPYVQLTLDILKKHKIKICTLNDHTGYMIQHGQKYKPHNHKIPGDFSSAAFLMAAAAITGSEILLDNLDLDIQQPDYKIIEILKAMGVEFSVSEGHLKIEGKELAGVDIKAENNPDLVPVCAAIACYAKGRTVIRNIERLSIKESDRAETIISELSKMGGNISKKDSAITIEGPSNMNGCIIDSHGDHRIVMACAIAALAAQGKTEIANAECVRKSYPNFFKDLIKLGGDVEIAE